MSPYLSIRGRWLLLSGVLFMFAGAVLSDPIILFLGQVQIALLAVAFMLLVPGSIALDRRRVQFKVHIDDVHAAQAAIVGDDITVRVSIENESRSNLYTMVATPFGAEPLDMTDVEQVYMLPARSKVCKTFMATVDRCGRWMVHGFDVCISDPLGLIETKDYLPCSHALEFYPKMVRQRRGAQVNTRGIVRSEGGRHTIQRLGLGTEIRDLRAYQPGDPLRHVAWKATVRRNKLMSKNYEHETSLSVYVLLDISTSMRGGPQPGQKLEHGIQTALSIADHTLLNRDSVGLMSFDEKLYGHILPSNANHQLRRMIHHLVGLNCIVDAELTELDDEETIALMVDYLLIQDRLDFRKGEGVDEITGINDKLLRRWVNSVYQKNRELHQSPSLVEGMFDQRTSRIRRFAQLRGLHIPYRVEARLGMKERGLVESIERLVSTSKGRHIIVVISDLCGIMNLDLLARGIKLAMIKGHRFKFIVPFTPAYSDADPLTTGDTYEVLRQLFTSAERDERLSVVKKLQSLGVEVEWTSP